MPVSKSHRATIVDRIAKQVEHAAERFRPDWHAQGPAGVDDVFTTDHAVGAAQGHTPHLAAAQVLLHLADQVQRDALLLGVDADGVVDRRNAVLGELDVKRRADDLRDASDVRAGSLALRCRRHE